MLADQPRAILNKVQSAILIFEPDTRVRFCNRTAERLLGLERNATQLHPAFWSWMEHDPTGLERILEDPRERLEAEILYPRSDEAVSYLHITVSHFEDEYLMATCWPNPALAASAAPALKTAQPVEPAPAPPEPTLNAIASAAAHLRQGLAEDVKSHSRLWDDFPSEALVIDDGYRILKRTSRALDKAPDADTCFAYRGRRDPCPNCPASLGFSTAWERSLSHSDNGAYVSETFVPVYGGQGAILTFEDHTGKVEMLRSIKAQRAKAKERAVTLARLLATLNKMRVGLKPADVTQYGLHTLMTECQALGAVLLVEDEQRRGLWLKQHQGLDERVLDRLAAEFLRLRRQDPAQVQLLPESLLPRAIGSLRQAPISAKDQAQIGLLMVLEPRVDNAEFIFSLFHNSLNNYLRERSLARHLALMAVSDELTGAYNRIFIERQFNTLASRWEREGAPFAVVLADANGLKPVNDTYGHAIGDALIQEVARRLKQHLGADDHIGRLGGDEFGMLLPGADQATAERYIQQVLEEESAKPFCPRPDLELVVSISLGAASTETAPPADLFRTADEAMYAMKQRYYASRA
ncbi:MAG: sensor domain-containing diguanylate cyclase, partial [Chromatiaceae bacterium]|nr:sensor domain-containing diguanylate cyclase [Chromatiaceae bacterium]